MSFLWLSLVGVFSQSGYNLAIRLRCGGFHTPVTPQSFIFFEVKMDLIKKMEMLGYDKNLAEMVYLIFIEMGKKDILENYIATKEAVKEVID